MSKSNRDRARERDIPWGLVEFNLHSFCEIKLKESEREIDRKQREKC
jgi:hypothetical protein